MSKPVLTKADFVRRYQQGEFGNRSPTWNTVREVLQSDYNGLIHIRNRQAGGPGIYDCHPQDLFTHLVWLEDNYGLGSSNFYFSGMAPSRKTLIQGEVRQDMNHYSFTYSLEKLAMRDALKKSTHHATGIQAMGLIRHAMDDSSYAWLHELLDNYPLHVIEFSVYSENFGTIPHRNTVFWEVRKY
jgi:hypothetical protein